jgi:spore germination cell wall hydrolase CwlJ-like protein
MNKIILAVFFLLTTSYSTVILGTETANASLISKTSQPELFCLAQNIYYEARGSSRADQMGVSDVVLNRVKDSRYPNTICEVVYQGKKKPSWKDPTKMVMVRNKCQFSWYCDGKADQPPIGDAWHNAQMVAYEMVYLYEKVNITDGATHYHAFYVTPAWAKKFTFKGRIGSHMFYKMK